MGERWCCWAEGVAGAAGFDRPGSGPEFFTDDMEGGMDLDEATESGAAWEDDDELTRLRAEAKE